MTHTHIGRTCYGKNKCKRIEGAEGEKGEGYSFK